MTNIPLQNVEALTEKIERLNRRAAKLNLPPLKLVWGEQIDERWYTDGERRVQEAPADLKGWNVLIVSYLPCEVIGAAPVVNGFSLLGVLDHTSGLVRDVPGCTVPVQFRQHDGSCDHCGHHRNRKETFVLRSEDGGHKVVGRNCLADFLRDENAAEGLVAFASYLASAESELSEWGSSGGRYVEYYDRDTTMILAAKIIRLFGWTSKAQAEAFDKLSTATLLYSYLRESKLPRSKWERDTVQIHDEPESDNDRELARGAIEFAQQHGASESNYLYNLSVILSKTEIEPKSLSFAISAIAAYNRELSKKIEIQKGTNAFVGQVKDKLKPFTATIRRVHYTDGTYGTTTILSFRDDAGNDYKWFASGSKDFAKGDKVTVSGTIKCYDTYEGHNSTVLTRCKMEVIDVEVK